jgi:hypothetical protein
MGYMLLVMEPPGQRQARSESEGRELYERMRRYSEDLQRRGLLIRSQSLKTHRTGVRISTRGDQTSVVDGPFAEAREMVGGFMLLTCETWDEAVAVARECPAAHWATVEVRELGPCFE